MTKLQVLTIIVVAAVYIVPLVLVLVGVRPKKTKNRELGDEWSRFLKNDYDISDNEVDFFLKDPDPYQMKK